MTLSAWKWGLPPQPLERPGPDQRVKRIGNKMARLVKEETDTGRLHIESPFMGESLVSKEFLKRTESKEYFRMQPEVNIIKIGG